MKKERYSVIVFTGYGCIEESCTFETIKGAKELAHRYDDYSNGCARIYDNVRDITLDCDGNLVEE